LAIFVCSIDFWSAGAMCWASWITVVYPLKRVFFVMLSPKSSWFVLQRQGTWKAVVDKVKAAKLRGALTTPVEELNYATYHILALMKLRRYGDAVDEFAAVGDLDAMHYRYEEYPSVYPDKSGMLLYLNSRIFSNTESC
jgi:hypothetical protein